MIPLTDPEIDLLVGRDIDAIIAVEVFNKPFRQRMHKEDCANCGGDIYICEGEACRYSTRSRAAHILIDRLAKSDFGFWCRIQTSFTPAAPYFVGFTPHGTTGWNGRPDYESGGRCFEEAAARAALKAVAAKQRQEMLEKVEVTG